jgi:Pyrimidine dimer DNA glycosylase
VRIWDVDVQLLCDRHLLGEHRELHAIWTVLTEGRRGYSRHPETLRWRGRLAALYARHDAQVAEMEGRGFRHASPLVRVLATGATTQTEFVDPPAAQLDRLAQLGCGCVRSRTAGGGVLSGNPSDAAVSRAIRAQQRK